MTNLDDDDTEPEGVSFIKQLDGENAKVVAASASVEDAAAAIAWLRARLEVQMENARTAGDDFRGVELVGLRFILDLHTPEPVDEYDQRRGWRFRAKCSSESWTCYTDGENLVASPCSTVIALAGPYALLPDFPEVFRAHA